MHERRGSVEYAMKGGSRVFTYLLLSAGVEEVY